jgi:cytochrome c oxidase cbb3-type subunit 3
MPIEDMIDDPAAMNIGKSLFANYCSQCHGANALGAPGFPNLTTGIFNYGGAPAQIEQTITNGRVGVMPPAGAVLQTDEQVNAMIAYIRHIPDGMDASSPVHPTYMSLCIACHGPTGQGNQALGGPSLADDNWLYGSSDAVLRKTLLEGRQGQMPAHGELLGPDRIHILAAYVYSLSQ